jgi:hypothetical protein
MDSKDEIIEELRGVIERLTIGFSSYHWSSTCKDKKRYYYTGGESALEDAFAVLGWDNPHIVEVAETCVNHIVEEEK